MNDKIPKINTIILTHRFSQKIKEVIYKDLIVFGRSVDDSLKKKMRRCAACIYNHFYKQLLFLHSPRQS